MICLNKLAQLTGVDERVTFRYAGAMSSYLSALRIYAPLGAWVAVGVSVVFWLATGMGGLSAAIGLAVGLGVILVAGRIALAATAKAMNRTRYQTLTDWIQELRAASESDPATAPRLKDAENQLDNAAGPHWISGEGYITVSRSLADVEASLMDCGSVASLLDQAQFDKLRLTGASIDDRDALLARLNTAINDLTAAMSQEGPNARPLQAAIAAVTQASVAEESKPPAR